MRQHEGRPLATNELRSAKRWDPRSRPQPLRLGLFGLLCLFDTFVVVAAALGALRLLVGSTQGFDFSEATVEIWGSTYTLDQPTFPWVVGVLGALSVVAGVQAFRGRTFRIVAAVGPAWVVLGVAAILTGSGEGLFVQRSVALALLVSARWAFID